MATLRKFSKCRIIQSSSYHSDMLHFRHFRRICCVLKCNRNYINPLYSSVLQRQNYGMYPRAQQMIRYYSPPASAIETFCWNCKKTTKGKSFMLCAECGHLQDVNENINYFDLLQCPRSFDLEPQQLTRHFRQLQTIVHPDKFSNKSEREQCNSADWSSLINKAYKTLSTPLERGQYMLQLNGIQIPEDNSTIDKEFLMEMMERNEEVEEATTESELRKLDERIVKEIHEMSNELIIKFNGNDLKGALATLVQMKYLRSLQKSIKSKLQLSVF